ncbi:MAG: hypothetical protein AAGJ35_14665, partial [Myxococcota bacterium]
MGGECTGICVSEECPNGDAVEYKGTPETCPTIRFVCDEDYDPFTIEDCGCGCAPKLFIYPPPPPGAVTPPFDNGFPRPPIEAVSPPVDDSVDRPDISGLREPLLPCGDESCVGNICIADPDCQEDATCAEVCLSPSCPLGDDVTYIASPLQCSQVTLECPDDQSSFDIFNCGCGCRTITTGFSEPDERPPQLD